MKKFAKKIFAVMLVLTMVFSISAVSADAYYMPYGFELEDEHIWSEPGDVIYFEDFFEENLGCDEYYVDIITDYYYMYDYVYDTYYDQEWESDFEEVIGYEAVENGVAIINVYYYDADEIVYDKYYLWVVSDGEDMGELTEAYVYDIDVNYKDEGYMYIEAYSDSPEGLYYTTIVDDEDSPIVIDNDGHFYAAGVGEGTATVYVIDAEGNVFESEINVNVEYSFIQWIIRILLFGWLWY